MTISGAADGRKSEPRVLRPRRAAPADAVRPTRAEVNLESLRHNLHVVRKHAGHARVWAVLKADGYGHGAPAVARTLERAGADGFCVALFEEGIELREAGIVAPILIMGGYYPGAHAEILSQGLTPVVYDFGQVEAFARLVRSGTFAGPVRVHLKVDTGMARLGVTMGDLRAFAARLREFPEVRVEGLMTHLACADALTLEDTQSQIVRFDEATAVLRAHGIRPALRHAANSAALFRSASRLDAVRPGIALFGVAPILPSGESLSGDLRQVMRVRTEVIALRDVEEGAASGYGALWRAARPSRLATIPVGYADGLSRHLTNTGRVLVRGRSAPIVGAVSMDLTTIDVTDIPDVGMRDEVVVLGSQECFGHRGYIGAGEVAHQSNTIAWEVLTSVSRRVPRFYREP